jgi:hypothetical protein
VLESGENMLDMQFLEIKDPSGLTEAIGAATRTLSREEKAEQRVSFVYASLGEKSGVTKKQVREALLADVAPRTDE